MSAFSEITVWVFCRTCMMEGYSIYAAAAKKVPDNNPYRSRARRCHKVCSMNHLKCGSTFCKIIPTVLFYKYLLVILWFNTIWNARSGLDQTGYLFMDGTFSREWYRHCRQLPGPVWDSSPPMACRTTQFTHTDTHMHSSI